MGWSMQRNTHTHTRRTNKNERLPMIEYRRLSTSKDRNDVDGCNSIIINIFSSPHFFFFVSSIRMTTKQKQQHE